MVVVYWVLLILFIVLWVYSAGKVKNLINLEDRSVENQPRENLSTFGLLIGLIIIIWVLKDLIPYTFN